QNMSQADLIYLAVSVVELVLILIATWIEVRWIRRLRHVLQARAMQWLEKHPHALGDPPPDAGAPDPTLRKATLERWFFLLERYAILTTGLLALWGIGTDVGLGHVTAIVVGFTL